MKRHAILLLGAIALTLHSAAAQTTLRITLDQAVKIALDENPTIKIAGMEIQRQEYVKKESVGNLLPNVSGTATYSYNIMNPVMFLPDGVFGPGTGGAMRMGFSNSYTAGANLAMPLYMPTVYRLLQLNDEQIKSAVESARSSKINLVNQVKKSYFSLLLAESSVDVIRQNIEYAGVVVENTRSSYDQGVVSEYDLITAEVQLSNLRPALINTENSIRVARLMLNMLLSLPLETELELTEDLYSYQELVQWDSENVVDLTDNSDLRMLDLQSNMLQRQLQMQRAAKIPTLAAFTQYQVLSQSNEWNIGHYKWKGTASAGLNLSVPLFAGFTNNNKIRQTQSSIDQLKLQRDYAEQSIGVQAQTALSDLRNAREQMLADKATRLQAEKGYTIAKSRFDIGAGRIIEVNSAQTAMLTADLNYSQSIFNYMSAQADFDRIIGRTE